LSFYPQILHFWTKKLSDNFLTAENLGGGQLPIATGQSFAEMVYPSADITCPSI